MSSDEDELPNMSVPAAPVDNGSDQGTEDEEDHGKTTRDFGEWLTRGLRPPRGCVQEIVCPCAANGLLQYGHELPKVKRWVGRFFVGGAPQQVPGCSGSYSSVHAFWDHLRSKDEEDHRRMLDGVNAYADSQPEVGLGSPWHPPLLVDLSSLAGPLWPLS